MSEKRRDNRGRILRNGESQRQDGRYVYKYKDLNGDTKFVYSWRLDKNGQPMVALHWERYFKHILNKYNSIYKVQFPKITPHVCRHTFCSNMAKSGMNPKTLQYILGHSDISVTLDTYTHLKFEDAKVEFDRVLEA